MQLVTLCIFFPFCWLLLLIYVFYQGYHPEKWTRLGNACVFVWHFYKHAHTDTHTLLCANMHSSSIANMSKYVNKLLWCNAQTRAFASTPKWSNRTKQTRQTSVGADAYGRDAIDGSRKNLATRVTYRYIFVCMHVCVSVCMWANRVAELCERLLTCWKNMFCKVNKTTNKFTHYYYTMQYGACSNVARISY